MPIYFYLRKTTASLESKCSYVCANPIETWGSAMKRSLILALGSLLTRHLPFTVRLYLYQLKPMQKSGYI